MSFRLLSLAFATALVFVAGPASAARIIVTIDGLKNAQGNVFIGLYASPAKFLQGNQTDAQRRVKASTAPVTVMFDNLPAGTYAVGAFHDENANDHLDTNVLGLPTEGDALSNGRVTKWLAPTQALRVPTGCSTVRRRTPMASGMRSSRSCILSSTSSFSQRLIRRSLVGVHRDFSRQVKQALRWR